MKEKETPLMRQYSQMKNKYPDTILLFRLGDFFETFNEDAVITSKVCGITLTKRHNGSAGECPLAGFPHHQLDAYLPKLVRAGYRVAVCEQLEDPKQARGIVRRGVIEVVTPGVAMYDKLLETKKNNYVCAIVLNNSITNFIAGIACADVSTGEFIVSEFSAHSILQVLETLTPSEIIISKEQKNELIEILNKLSFKPPLTKLEPWIFDNQFGREAMLGHFKTQNLKGFGIDEYSVGIAAAGAILHYIKETQNGEIKHLKKISLYNPSEFMILDYATKRNLEITFSMFEGTKEGSLISIIDKTCTPMGGRLLKKWLTRPLLNIEQIKKRLSAVRVLYDNDNKRKNLRETLQEIGDIERLISKICTGRANPRDVVALKLSIAKIPDIKKQLGAFNSQPLNTLINRLEDVNDVVEMISKSMVDEPSVQLGTGNVFRHGYSSGLDSYVDAKTSAKEWVNDYQEKEKQESGIPSLKVGFTSVFGYYIEITNAHKDKVPTRYDRKQTLTNAERYTTPELKQFEEKILNAEEKILKFEQDLFQELRNKIALHTEKIQDNAGTISIIDCLQCFAETSKENNYNDPEIDDSDIIDIVEGRHPVVEKLLEIGESFHPNPTKLDASNEQIHIITGPNMSGKSCYLRQVALIVLLTQIGCFVPAKKAKIGLVDRIFTRVGAQDNITAGESTFLVEMQEAANIMNNATSKSLILLDEVGRGTATYDGISIAWAITEHIHDTIGARTLFATHYHELNDIANRYDRIVNYKVEVVEAGDTIIFSHRVMPGTSDHSFGIHVAQMAGLPIEVTGRANIIMKSLEESSKENGSGDPSTSLRVTDTDTKRIEVKKARHIPDQLAIFEFRDDLLREQILKIEIDSLSPLEALKTLSAMQKEARKKINN
ncbi:MAG: DNA mismatch repair protein MutS [Ignavibacteria bacterium RIFOXYC2_FULL_35_21]|nr:MAG: DNA mismatch repair protein MutS [Ignavibacteria bacterium RIFOXYA2_FULL_35_10]OGV23988.1 MAG: DNA mismatch repair protein MutS [Ignavibacteria bacterium RIFOXYC2_FULL_35_21]